MELDREQIIKAWEWCIQSESCEYCEYKRDSDEDVCTLRDDALALIRELTEENERLRAELEQRPPKLFITKLPKKGNENV